MKTDEAEILVANTSAMFTHEGRVYNIVKDKTTARRGAKILRGHEHLFKPLVVDYDVEPKRGPGRPRKEEVAQRDSLAQV